MCIFSKRNVHFLLIYARQKKSVQLVFKTEFNHRSTDTKLNAFSRENVS